MSRHLGLLGLLLVSRTLDAAPIRGLDPALSSHYTSGATFTCLDGTKRLSSVAINDDFCDCVDGSDEPGTSACSNGKFYCRNRAHQPRVLNSSAVDDAVCDCCDGSDEVSGCANTCVQEGAAARKALQASVAESVAGLKAKEKYLKQATTNRKLWEAEVHKSTKEIERQEAAVQKLRGKMDEVEAAEAAERSMAQQLEDARRKAKEASQAALDAVKPPEQEAAGPEAAAEQLQEEDGATGPAEAAPAEPAEAEEELSDEERGKRIAQQWTHDPAAAGSVQEEEASMAVNEDEGAKADAESSVAADAALQPGLLARAQAWVYGRLGWPASSGEAAKAARQTVRQEYNAKNAKLNEARRRKSDVEGKLAGSYGPSDEFLPLVDQCYKAVVDKYTYVICPFKDASQKEGHSTVRLGAWKGFDATGSHMVYENGQNCWSGPNRSIQVELVCGRAEELSRVEEPSRCSYTAQLVTPAACSLNEVRRLQAELAAAEEEAEAAGHAAHAEL